MWNPRIGGEKFGEVVDIMNLEGSPPRGRGKVENIVQTAAHLGITPAQAGKSRRAGRCAAASGDHPRVGGEKMGRVHVWSK